MKHSLFRSVLRTVAALCLGAALPTFAALDNQGKDFLLPFLPNLVGTAQVLQLHLTSETETTVDVEYPANSPTFSVSVNLTPGDITVVDLPLTADDWTSNQVANNAVRASSDEEFVVYTVNLQYQTSDAALGLPVDTMNTDYIVAAYPAAFSDFGANSHFIVYAAFDETEVTINQSVDAGGHVAGVPYTISLGAGEAFYLEGGANGAPGDLSGSIITANRPVGVVNGNGCTQVPNGTTACDAIYEIAQPTQTWGTSILTANLPNRANGSIYRVFASRNDTDVELDGVLLGSINRGEFIETDVIDGNHLFESTNPENPIYVVQFMTGQDYPNATRTGDPAMGNMIPADQYGFNYTFSTAGDGQFAEQYLTVIAHNDDLGSVLLDGVAIPSTDFEPISSTDFSVAIQQLSEGVHTTSSPSSSLFGHGITVEGYNPYDSFIYPGGALFEFIARTGDPWDPICSGEADSGTFNGSVTDNMPSEDVNGNGVLDSGEDTNGNSNLDSDTGVFFVELTSATNATLTVNPFTPGDGSATFVVSQNNENEVGSALVTATDGVGNTCTIEVEFEGMVDPEPVVCDFDGDEDVDRDDLSIIRAARNTPAGTDDPMDLDDDGMITMNDARMCVVQCTRSRCATE